MTFETLAIAGLAAPASIAVDRWGIPHLRAETQDDLFLLQGFNAARDRLWQIDLWRKRGLGRLAEDFGPGYLAQDHAARHFLYRGDMAEEWASYAPDARAICEAFVRGINAYVALTEREPQRLPPEFALFGTRPGRWQTDDVVRIRSHALTRNAPSEVLRANVLKHADLRTDLLRQWVWPPATPSFAGGVTPEDVPLHVLDLFKLGTAPVSFEPARLAATLAEAGQWRKVTEAGDILRVTEEQGSNNWVVSGSRTATGRPILATDPHRALELPSLRYLVHLAMPGFDAIGCGEPVLPGVSFGHNGHAAFGLTIHRADQEDIFVYETHPDDAGLYRHDGVWKRFDRDREVFRVKGAPDQMRTVSFSVHGPVLHEDLARRRTVALRSVWFEPGTCAYLGSLSAMRAKTVREFGATLHHWGAPSVNHVCADTNGTIGWFTAGRVPLRRNWQGLLPVPGDGSHEWAGFLPAVDMARAIDPPEGFFATANEFNLPADWPHDIHPVGFEWQDDSRATRIKQVLAADAAHTLDASCRLQGDLRSLPAERICRLLPEAAEDPDEAAGLALLRGWNHDVASASPAAALFEIWLMLHLKAALLSALVPDATLRALLRPVDITALMHILESCDARLGPDPRAARDALLLRSLGAAVCDCARRLGADSTAWQWGSLHHGYFRHPAAPLRAGTDWDVGPLPVGGSASTVMNSAYRLGDFRANNGASVRMVIDVGAWDNSRCINAPGQSGHPDSPHYRDLAPLWAEAATVPLLYSPARIAAETSVLISLTPG